MSLTNLFEQESEALRVQDDQLTGVAALAKRAKQMEKELEEAETSLKGLKERFRKMVEETIPEALAEMGLSSFRMEDGSSIDIKPFYSASITEARRAEAFQWLRDHGFDDIIKNTVSVRFGRGEAELCERLINLLGSQGFRSEQAEKVEPQTLKAWVRERVERGDEFPTDLFGAYIGKKAVIKTV
jgi:hypothetical protein